MGGSATVDGGAGMLQALGVRFLDEKGNLLQELPESLTKLHTVDDTQLDPRIKDSTITVLCDVSNPLLGKEGAAAVFGPQKGASEAAVHTLEAGVSVLAKIALSDKGKDIGNRPHTGTAGGAAAGLYAFAGARLVNGIDQFLEMTGFEQALEKAALVITGEGSIDEQTLGGKAPLGVAKKAKAMGIPVIGMAGKVPMTTIKALDACFDILLPISNGPLTLEEAILYTRENLKRTACLAGNMLALQNGILPTVSASEQVISNQQNSLHTS
jgi:glycerate kinase